MANIVRYNPFNEVVSLREAMDRLFEDKFIPRNGLSFGNRGAGSNLYETTDGFVLQIPMPGINPEAVEITAREGTLNLKWETSVDIPEDATVHWKGFAAGKYEQSFTLPTTIDNEKVEANYQNGILTLSLPKAEHAKPRTIKVVAKK